MSNADAGSPDDRCSAMQRGSYPFVHDGDSRIRDAVMSSGYTDGLALAGSLL